MNKAVKMMISFVLSFALVVCLAPSLAQAEEVTTQEDEISVASINIGEPYYIKDKYGKITAQFSNLGTLLVTYTDLSGKGRYIEMYVSTPSKSFEARTAVVKKNKSHSESYGINFSVEKVTITIYRHTSTSSSSGQIDPLTGVMQ